MRDQAAYLDRLKAALADRYRIDREIGRGGMATVYLAEDLRHERKVAIKVLRPELVAVIGPERFLREIKLTARLNHPHILPLLDSGEADRVLYYVMPYVEGESLRQKLNRETQLSIDEALLLGQQVAAALAYAHREGVIHRDIKPENILLHAGEAVVADFGIALALSAAGRGRLTETGLSLGTPEYMSPEQASGAKQLDTRSDIYSLGCVVYEMLGGDPPFTAHTPQAVIARQVLDPPPSLRTLRPSVPAAMEDVVKRALAKSPADRWQTADELLARLKGLEAPSSATPKGVRFAGGRDLAMSRRTLAILAAATAIGAAAIALPLLRRDAGEGTALPLQQVQLTFTGRAAASAISPDGTYFAHLDQELDGWSLLVQDVMGSTTLALGKLGRGLVPSLHWSPDGAQLLVDLLVKDGDVHVEVYSRFGGRPRQIFLAGPAARWSPDGAQLVSWWQDGKRLRFTNTATGDTSFLRLPMSFSFLTGVDWSPTGALLAITTVGPAEPSRVWTIAIDGSQDREVVRDSAPRISVPRWSSKGDAIYYLRSSSTLGLRTDVRKVGVSGAMGRPVAAPTVVLHDLVMATEDFSVSADGTRLLYARNDSRSHLWLVELTEVGTPEVVRTAQLTAGTSRDSSCNIAPSGTRLVFGRQRGAMLNLFTMPIRGGPAKQLTFGEDEHLSPAWSPDGTQVAFLARGEGVPQVHVVDVATGSARILSNGRAAYSLDWAQSGDIIYQRADVRNLHRLDPASGRDRPLLEGDEGYPFFPRVSPDGKYVAYWWNRFSAHGPDPSLWVLSLEDGTQTRLADGLLLPIGWRPDGTAVYASNPGVSDTLYSVSLSGTGSAPLVMPRFSGAHGAPQCVSRDGKHIVVAVPDERSDIWMIENFDPMVR